jgi:hypothetical protein
VRRGNREVVPATRGPAPNARLGIARRHGCGAEERGTRIGR